MLVSLLTVIYLFSTLSSVFIFSLPLFPRCCYPAQGRRAEQSKQATKRRSNKISIAIPEGEREGEGEGEREREREREREKKRAPAR